MPIDMRDVWAQKANSSRKAAVRVPEQMVAIGREDIAEEDEEGQDYVPDAWRSLI
jgi:hypothetical protein